MCRVCSCYLTVFALSFLFLETHPSVVTTKPQNHLLCPPGNSGVLRVACISTLRVRRTSRGLWTVLENTAYPTSFHPINEETGM